MSDNYEIRLSFLDPDIIITAGWRKHYRPSTRNGVTAQMTFSYLAVSLRASLYFTHGPFSYCITVVGEGRAAKRTLKQIGSSSILRRKRELTDQANQSLCISTNGAKPPWEQTGQ